MEREPAAPRRTEVVAETLAKYLERGADANIAKLLQRTRPEDVAVLLAGLASAERQRVFQIFARDAPDGAADVLTLLEPALRREVVERLSPEETAGLLERVPIADAVFVVESLPDELHARILELAEGSELADVQTHLGYREGSAGRLMDTELFALEESSSVRAAIAAIQEQSNVEMIFYLYVVDRDRHLVGVTSLRQLLLSSPDRTLAEFMSRAVIKVRLETDQEEVAALAARYDLLAVPVVDDGNRLVGIVTVDDIIDVVKEEATEDLFKMAGTSDEEILYPERTWRVARLRLPALLVGTIGLLLAGLLLETFQLRFGDAVFVLAFVPLVMGLGGSIGGQAAAVAVSGMASGELAPDGGRLVLFVGRQARVGAALGLAAATVAGLAAWALQRQVAFGFAVAAALFLSAVVAAASGACLPLVFRRAGLDPALSSGPFLASIHDLAGILVYFGLAGIALGRWVD